MINPEDKAGWAFEGPIGDGASLAPLTLEDVDELFALVDSNRDHLRPWMPWLGVTTAPGDVRTFVQSTIDQRSRNDGYQCAIRQDCSIVGVIGHHRIDWTNKLTSLGYWLSAGHQGRGIMTRACTALIDFAFEDLELNRVEICAAVGNAKSTAVIERLGLVDEGIRRQAEWVHDHFVDLRCFAILRDEWAAYPPNDAPDPS